MMEHRIGLSLDLADILNSYFEDKNDSNEKVDDKNYVDHPNRSSIKIDERKRSFKIKAKNNMEDLSDEDLMRISDMKSKYPKKIKNDPKEAKKLKEDERNIYINAFEKLNEYYNGK